MLSFVYNLIILFLGGKLVAAPIIAGLAIGAGVVVLGIGVIALPFYGSYKLHQHMKQRKNAKKHRKMVADWHQKLSDMRNMGMLFTAQGTDFDCSSLSSTFLITTHHVYGYYYHY